MMDTGAEKLNYSLSDSIAGAGAVTSVIGWTTLYYLLCTYLPQWTSEWHCRLITVLHAVIVVMLSAWSVFVQGPWPFTDPGNVSLVFVADFCNLAVMVSTKYKKSPANAKGNAQEWCMFESPVKQTVFLL